MHAVERELIKVCDFKPRKKYADRQEYLRAILMAANKITDDDFETLSDEAVEWFNACINIHNARKDDDLPDFDEVKADGSEDEETEADEGDEEVEGDEAPDTDSDPKEDEPGDEDADEGEDEDEPSKDDEVEAEEEPEPVKKPAKAKAKPAPAKPAKAAKPAPKPAKKSAPTDDEEDVILDKWGCMQGSKNSQALNLFEQGATSKEVKQALGGTYYNILGKMVRDGHKVEKEGHLVKLTHKDEVGKPAKKSKK